MEGAKTNPFSQQDLSIIKQVDGVADAEIKKKQMIKVFLPK